MFGHGDEGSLLGLLARASPLDPGTRSGLAALCAAGAGLPAHRRAAFGGEIASLLDRRLQLEADRKACPEIAAERIEAPIIICGLPRSGTSLLHALLAQDPENRAPRCWELMTPSPPAPSAQEQRRRLDAADGAVRALIAATPGILKAHPYWDEGGDVAVECEDIMQMSFISPYFSAFFDIPDYERWRRGADHSAAYRLHRAFLQHLQFRAPGRRWALKGVAHLGHLTLVAETYPDLCLVWPHRDPVELLASMATLVAITRRATEPTELRAIFEELTLMTVQNLESALAHPFAHNGRILHIPFAELNRDPAAAIRQVYARLGREVASEHEVAMRTWLASPANDAARHGRAVVDLTRFGATREGLRARFARYYESGLLEASG